MIRTAYTDGAEAPCVYKSLPKKIKRQRSNIWLHILKRIPNFSPENKHLLGVKAAAAEYSMVTLCLPDSPDCTIKHLSSGEGK